MTIDTWEKQNYTGAQIVRRHVLRRAMLMKMWIRRIPVKGRNLLVIWNSRRL